MADSALRPDASLPELLTYRARHSSDARLVLDAGLGVLAAVGALLWRPPGWFSLLSAALCFAAFGVWGIVDRELGERGEAGRLPRLLRVVRGTAAAVGALAAVALLLSLMRLALGTWIS